MRAFATALLSLAAPGGARGLSILVYHRVLPEPDPLFPEQMDAARFAQQLDVLGECFNVMPLPDAVVRLRSGTLPRRAACITFDDGYADNVTVALPLLRDRGMHATFFIASGFLDGGRMWNDTVIESVRRTARPVLDAACAGLCVLPCAGMEQKRRAVDALIGALKYLPIHERAELVNRIAHDCGAELPADLMMSSRQVRELHSAGMEVGAHTVNHPILATLPAAAARAEIASGRDMLEAITAGRVGLFAYPNGKPGQDYLPEHVALVRAMGFDGAFTTAWGRDSADTYQLPRFTPWDRSPQRFALRLARNQIFRAQTVALAAA